MRNAARPVTISIVSHGQWGLIEPLLDQLDRWCGQWIDKVVLTINEPEAIPPIPARQFPVMRIDNPSPRGFGANHNVAFKMCKTPWFLVLNPDIRIEDQDVIGRLVQVASPGSGLVTPRIWEPNGKAPEPFRSLLSPFEIVRRRMPAHDPPAEPAWVAGMFMLIRRQAYSEVGGFDERYFMYCEDFDLCARLRLAGWALQVDGTKVVHMAQRASRSSFRLLLSHIASLAKVWTSHTYWAYSSLLSRSSRI